MGKDDIEADGLGPCLKIVGQLCKHKAAQIFLGPVDPVKHHAPGYYDIIKHPMDLQIIKRKLKARQYTSPFEVDAHVQLMLNNCFTYNAGVKHWCDVAQSVKELWTTFWEGHRIEQHWRAHQAWILQDVPDAVLYQPGGSLQAEQQAAVETELLRAASWLVGAQLRIQCNGMVGRLLGGHHSKGAALWTYCECAACNDLPLTLSASGRMMTLQELHHHCTASSPPAPGPPMSNQQLLGSFHMAELDTASTPEFLKSSSEALGGAQLVGSCVWIYWFGTTSDVFPDQLGSWREARVAAYDEVTGEHVLQYQLPKGSGRPPCLRVYLRVTFHHAGPQAPPRDRQPTPFPPLLN